MARFRAAGWAVRAVDGHHPGKIAAALRWARRQDRPSLVACQTRINRGAGEREGDPHGHGYSLFDPEIAAARAAMGWTSPPFEIPGEIAKAWRKAGARGGAARRAWTRRLKASDRGADFTRAERGDLPADAFAALDAAAERVLAERPAAATRVHSGAVLERLVPAIPEMIAGSADLTGSNNTIVTGMTAFDAPGYAGRYIHYGVREFAMAAAMNGMAVHGGVIPYSGTFLAFSDYSRPAIRLGALMGARVIHVMTHDSIGLGEDGPTHQPVEHLASLRAMPNLLVFRPADAAETMACWKAALSERRSPSIMALSRQKTPAVCKARAPAVERGAYELAAADGEAQVTIFSTGTEVAIALAARGLLEAQGIPTRVVSAPCWEFFDRQDPDYQDAVIGTAPVRLAVEAGVRQGWDRFIGERGAFIGMTGFGASAPFERLYAEFAITPEAVAAAARRALSRALSRLDKLQMAP
jgi:transketolase